MSCACFTWSARLALLLATALAPATVLYAQTPWDQPELDFLLGTWYIQEMELLETWEKTPQGYLGRAVHRESGDLFETFSVGQQEGAWFYEVHPVNQDPVQFALSEYRPGYARFQNPQNPLPLVITYFRDGDRNRVRLEGMREGSALEITMELRPWASDPASGQE